MKLIKTFFLSLLVLLITTGCGNKEYVGYWCKYEETGTIIVTLNENNTSAERAAIEKVIGNFNGLSSYDFMDKETFANETGEEGEAYDTYFIYFLDNTTIDEALMSLQKLSGVKNVEKNNIKTNVSLYEFIDSKKYKYQDSLGIEEKYNVTGTYKINDKVLNLTSPTNTTTLYIKDDYLCADSACNTIYTRTNEYCEKND